MNFKPTMLAAALCTAAFAAHAAVPVVSDTVKQKTLLYLMPILRCRHF